MTGTDPTRLASHVRAIARAADPAGGIPDADLVRRYADAHDAASFEVLVWRHGPMVWAACVRVLRHRQDAEDAFQAAFLALARRAHAVGRGSIGGWLHRVATNAALKVRGRRRPTSLLPPDVPDEAPADAEFAGVLDEELGRLPDHYRTAFVLCCLEGLTNAEAARELGCPVGTVDSRLHAARTRLRDRLARRGFGPAALATAALPLSAPVAAAAVALGSSAPPPSPVVDRLADQIGRTMSRTATALGVAAAALVVVTAAVAVWAGQEPPADPPRPAPAPAPAPQKADPALLFTELVLKPGETGSRTIRLTRATFRDGRLAGRDDLHTGDASGIGFNAHYRVVGGRFVVFQTATVYDLVEKRVRYSPDGGRVLAVEGTAVYYFNGSAAGPEGVFRYDTATGEAARVADPGAGRWGLRGAVSPGGSKAVVREWANAAVPLGSEMLYKLALDRVGRPREPLGEFAATSGATGAGWPNDQPPGVWLDDDRFVTQTTLGKVVVLDTAAGTRAEVVTIPPTHRPGEKAWDAHGAIGFTPLGFQQPRFALLPDGRVAYDADLAYTIDVAKKTWEKAAWRPLGHGFEYSAVPDRIEGPPLSGKTAVVTLRHRGKVIGTSESVWWTTPDRPRAVAADGQLAVIEQAVRRPGARPTDAVRVWSAVTGEWQTLDGWADGLIGWVR